MNARPFRYGSMSRLDDALKEHEKKLRDELETAYKRRAEVQTEINQINENITRTELDLAEVSAEVQRRGLVFQKAQNFIINEGLYD